jgi:hypothetical protein
MQSLKFINSKGQELVIDYTRPYMLQNLVGISEAPINILATRGYKQDGQTSAGQFFNARDVTFSLIVFGNSNEEVFNNRRKLIAFLNPKQDLTCIYENDFMGVKFSCRVDSSPRFQASQNTGTFLYQTCNISLVADDPYLYDIQESLEELAVVTPALSFPLELEPDIIFSDIVDKEIVIDNTGDVNSPVRIRFLGATTNPSITNKTTGEFIKVNKVIGEKEILEITTGYGNKKVEIISPNNTRTNAFNCIDLSSSFWQLLPGENTITYDADSGADSATVLIYFSNRYVGV